MLLAVIFFAATRLAAAKESSLEILDAMRFPLAEHAPSFLVFAKNATVKNLSVKVLEIRHSDTVLSASALDVKCSKDVPPEGARVTLTPIPGAFVQPGDYVITLDISGTADAKPLNLKRVATLTRARAVITAPPLEKGVIAFMRTYSGGSSHDQKIDLVNPGTPLSAVMASGGAVSTADTHILGKGEVTVGGLPNPIPTGRSTITLKLAEFDAGEQEGRLLLIVPASQETVEIPFKVRVTDHWLWPMLVIALGVGLALFVNVLTTKLKPKQETIANAMRVADAIHQLRGLTGDADHISEFNDFADRLRLAEQKASAGSLTEANTSLQGISTDVEALRKRIAEESRGALIRRAEIGVIIESLRITAEQADADRLVTGLDRVDQRIGARQFKSAAAELAALQTIVDEVKTKTTMKRDARQSEAALRAKQAERTIEADPPQLWTVGRELSFAVPADVDVRDAVIVWNFGDGEERQDSAKTRKAYRRAGNYPVTVSVRVGGTETVKLLRMIVISETEAGSALLQAAKRTWRYDVILSLIGLVAAVVTGFWMLYADKAFGTFGQYLEAFLWGFGIDHSVRGLATVMIKIKG